ncbi:hypothetical protein LIER_38715 [Lithospermum erythrorhizon]|uniref:Uncharacterized protein n=1 Tax=Lithospermum erythrorhizon TaxID=34254 RepID=A0AAV3Q3P8_LITER
MERKTRLRPPDANTSGTLQEEGSNTTYALVARKVSSYNRMDLAFITPAAEANKPMMEMLTIVVMAGAEKWKHTFSGTRVRVQSQLLGNGWICGQQVVRIWSSEGA